MRRHARENNSGSGECLATAVTKQQKVESIMNDEKQL